MTRSRPALDIRVTDANVRGTEIYRDGEFKRPDLIAECQGALLRPISTPLTTAPEQPTPQPKTG